MTPLPTLPPDTAFRLGDKEYRVVAAFGNKTEVFTLNERGGLMRHYMNTVKVQEAQTSE